MAKWAPSDSWLNFSFGPEISLQDFRAFEEEKFQKQSARCEQATRLYLREKLSNLSLDDSPDDLVEEILYEGLEIYANADVPDEDMEDINDTGQRFSQLFERTMLLLIAPRGEGAKRKITVPEDIESRRMQYESFLELYPGIDPQAEGEDCPVPDPLVVMHYDDCHPLTESLLSGIKKFFEKYAGTSKKVVVVFNGHGCSSGMLLENEMKPVPIDRYIDDVKKVLKETSVVWGGSEYPLSLDIVLAQCYGHLHSFQEQDDKVRVICLTNNDNLTTSFTVKLTRDRRRRLKSSVHNDLNKFAEQEAAREERIKKGLDPEFDELPNNVATETSAKQVPSNMFVQSGMPTREENVEHLTEDFDKLEMGTFADKAERQSRQPNNRSEPQNIKVNTEPGSLIQAAGSPSFTLFD